jgi:hypothetical protein
LSQFALAPASSDQSSAEESSVPLVREFNPKSVEEIKTALVTPDGKPTLVEFYTDFGLG